MPDINLRSWLSTYDFSTAFRLAAYDRVLSAVKKYKVTAAGKLITEAVAADRALRADERRFSVEALTSTRGNPAAAPLDAKVDRLLSAIPDAARVAKSTMDDEDERAQVDAFIESLFPAGLAAVVNARYVDELSLAEGIIEELGKHKAMVKALGLSSIVSQLETHVPRFAKALSRPRGGRTLTFDELRALRSEGMERFARYIFIVGGQFNSNSEADLEARRALLGPILDLNDQIADALKRSGGNPNELTPPGEEPKPDA